MAKYLGIYQLSESDPRYITFEDYYAKHRSEFEYEADAWIYWYINENQDPDEPRIQFDDFPENARIRPGTQCLPGDRGHIPIERVREVLGIDDENEIRSEFYQANLCFGTTVFLLKKKPRT